VQTLFIQPSTPWENGYVESFNGKLRDEFLNGEVFYTLPEDVVLVEQWMRLYNTVRPHQAGGLPPAPETIKPSSWFLFMPRLLGPQMGARQVRAHSTLLPPKNQEKGTSGHPKTPCLSRGAAQIRTGDRGFAVLCLTAWLRRQQKRASSSDAAPSSKKKAGNRTRTGDPHLGKVMLYQLSYSRKICRIWKVKIAPTSVKAGRLKLRYLTTLSRGSQLGE
jgi:hypothetical protein